MAGRVWVGFGFDACSVGGVASVISLVFFQVPDVSFDSALASGRPWTSHCSEVQVAFCRMRRGWLSTDVRLDEFGLGSDLFIWRWGALQFGLKFLLVQALPFTRSSVELNRF